MTKIEEWAKRLEELIEKSPDKVMWTADEVAGMLGVSINYARDIMRFYAIRKNDVKYERGRLYLDVPD